LSGGSPPLRFQPRRPGPSALLARLLRRTSVRAFVAVLAVASVAAGLALAHSAGRGASPKQAFIPGTTRPLPAVRDGRPNIVFVLTDDLAMNLLRYMPHVQAMERDGMTFRNYFVSDSLCCPSRASIFTGNFPHDTGVFGNTGPHGGFNVFYRRGEERETFSLALQRAGYRTAMMGKYLNGYLGQRGFARDGTPANVPPSYVPPGWTRWDVAGYGYPEFNYVMNADGELQFHGHQPQDYLTDVIARDGVDFINKSAETGKPFFLELATFAPHHPYTPAPRNRKDFPGLRAPRTPAFNRLPTHPPSWLRNRSPLDFFQIARIDRAFRRRAQSVQAVDDMIGQIEQTLASDGLSNNTYIVFSSDNGLHMGDYRLMPGKLTAYDTDIHVPLVVVGPGIPPGTSTGAMAENIDLAKTFVSIGGTSMGGDGHSLVPLLLGAQPNGWRNAVLIEHHGPRQAVNDPDFQQPASGNPITYEAMRTDRFLYVEYVDGEREFYDLAQDPFELHNLAPFLSPVTLQQLHSDLLAIESCHDGATCWSAMHVAPVVPAFIARPTTKHRAHHPRRHHRRHRRR
jgi:arylsulfatase A-like enzyme